MIFLKKVSRGSRPTCLAKILCAQYHAIQHHTIWQQASKVFDRHLTSHCSWSFREFMEENGGNVRSCCLSGSKTNNLLLWQ